MSSTIQITLVKKQNIIKIIILTYIIIPTLAPALTPTSTNCISPVIPTIIGLVSLSPILAKWLTIWQSGWTRVYDNTCSMSYWNSAFSVSHLHSLVIAVHQYQVENGVNWKEINMYLFGKQTAFSSSNKTNCETNKLECHLKK